MANRYSIDRGQREDDEPSLFFSFWRQVSNKSLHVLYQLVCVSLLQTRIITSDHVVPNTLKKLAPLDETAHLMNVFHVQNAILTVLSHVCYFSPSLSVCSKPVAQ